MYDSTNQEVYPDQGPASARAGAQPPGEAGFFRWLARQQTYYRNLLKVSSGSGRTDCRAWLIMRQEGGRGVIAPRTTPRRLRSPCVCAQNGLLPGVDAKLVTPPGGEAPRGQHGVLDTLRQVNAVARPEQYLSHSQAVHHPMRTCEDPGLTALVKERTRLRTMGFPPPQIEGTYPTVESKMRAAAALAEASAEGNPAGSSGAEPSKVDIVFSKVGDGRGARPFTASGSAPGSRRPSTSSGGRALAPSARPASASAALPSHHHEVPLGAISARPPGPKLTGPPPRQEKETFKSQLPIKWAAASSTQPSSTYADAFGSLAAGASRKLASAGAQAGGPVCAHDSMRGASLACGYRHHHQQQRRRHGHNDERRHVARHPVPRGDGSHRRRQPRHGPGPFAPRLPRARVLHHGETKSWGA